MTAHLLLTLEFAAEAVMWGALEVTGRSPQRPWLRSEAASSPGTSAGDLIGAATVRLERIFVALGRGNYEYAIALTAATYGAPASFGVASAAVPMSPQ